jgi:hypothetical protein
MNKKSLMAARLNLSRKDRTGIFYFFVKSEENTPFLIDELNQVRFPEEPKEQIVKGLEIKIEKGDKLSFIDVANSTLDIELPVITNMRDYLTFHDGGQETVYTAGNILCWYREEIHRRLKKPVGMVFVRGTLVEKQLYFLDSYSWKIGQMDYSQE